MGVRYDPLLDKILIKYVKTSGDIMVGPNSTTFFQIQQADTTPVFNVDTTNAQTIFNGLEESDQNKVKKILKEEQLGLTKKDKKLKSQSVADRASKVNKLFKKAKTREEQVAIAKDLQAKGILTTAVIKELQELNRK